MKNIGSIFRSNNFDLIRLFAALQVAISHTASELRVEVDTGVLSYFPGVPIFFFISGFLISKSYESNSILKEYAFNRIFRIYPALIVCTFLSILAVYLTGYFTDHHATPQSFIFWIGGQISFVQFYNPDFMRSFGTGVLNGSLWTISVELQFYILIPILYLVLRGGGNFKLIFLVLLFLLINIIHFLLMSEYSEMILFKLWHVSFLPWFYMFLIGVLFQRNFETFYNILSGKFIYLLVLYLGLCYVMVDLYGWTLGNAINPVLYLLLSMVIFSFAYTFAGLGDFVLRRNDISYGVYIWHMPIVNLFIYYGFADHILSFFISMCLTILLSLFSWFIVEKPAMLLKKHPLHSLKISHTA